MTHDTSAAADTVQAETQLIPGLAPVVPLTGEPTVTPSSFDLVLRGYDRHQVDEHLRQLAGTIEQLRTELARTSSELERGRPSYDALGERVAQILGLAEAEAAQLRSDAERDAADLRVQAHRDAEELVASVRREVDELGQRRSALLAEMEAMRQTLGGILTGAVGRDPDQTALNDLSSDTAAPVGG